MDCMRAQVVLRKGGRDDVIPENVNNTCSVPEQEFGMLVKPSSVSKSMLLMALSGAD